MFVMTSVHSGNTVSFRGKNVDELQAGARVDVDDAKNNPLDFVLWKLAKPDEPSWKSPWGAGRPGWHIECSAMSMHCLGEHFDIHGGGQDLQFPHHENEIAQSEGATGCTFANYWIHNGFVRVDDEKMSKSLGNFFTVREILDKYRPEEVRYFILSSHYRSQLNYSESHLNEAQSSLARLYTALSESAPEQGVVIADYVDTFKEMMNDDFNTARATSLLHEIASELNRENDKSSKKALAYAATLKHLGGILGILQTDPETFLKSAIGAASSNISDEQIEALIQQRQDAKSNKNYQEADSIRDELAAAGITLEDSPEGTKWRR